ncbi:membrane protein DedA, SNARE-associated domain [Gemmobacter aquatilis]|uniref:Membrane protein DedA, SNARE-associated domain n=2 Tax=Gemmobacter aquatilis TaxID=933059 RepID=A0A1H7YCN4_9RHOB|nr:membrane protein DedA, SNARE-associated domain [Gemmobacter aquatilis]
MLTPEGFATLINQYGLWVIAPVAVLEGPIVTVISVWMARAGLLGLQPLLLVLVLADLAGDLVLYALGRGLLPTLPRGLRKLLGLRPARVAALASHFRSAGARTLMLGKLTHSAGAMVLVAAGVARMPLLPFLFWNLLATLPKTAVFAALGWLLGDAHALIGDWIAAVSLALLLPIGWIGLCLLRRHRVAP